MGNEKEGSTVVNYKAPAITITEHNGDIEKVLEFATAEDYAAYKRIEAWSLMTDEQKDRHGVAHSPDCVNDIIKIVNAIDRSYATLRRKI